MQLTATWTGTSLIPADEETRKSVAKLAIGQKVTWVSKKVRNLPHHRLRFAWVGELYELLEHLKIFEGKENLRQLLTLKTDIGCILVKDPFTGELSKQARSWSYESMNEVDFSLMSRQITAYLLTEFMPQAIVIGNWDNATINRFERLVIND
jgi:hypothetical protein